MIPKDLNECFLELPKMFGSLVINEIKNKREEDLRIFYHGLLNSIKNYWELWEVRSPLVQYFNHLEIYHADDMTDIIIISFWRHLHNKPIELESQIHAYQKSWLHFEGKEGKGEGAVNYDS